MCLFKRKQNYQKDAIKCILSAKSSFKDTTSQREILSLASLFEDYEISEKTLLYITNALDFIKNYNLTLDIFSGEIKKTLDIIRRDLYCSNNNFKFNNRKRKKEFIGNLETYILNKSLINFYRITLDMLINKEEDKTSINFLINSINKANNELKNNENHLSILLKESTINEKKHIIDMKSALVDKLNAGEYDSKERNLDEKINELDNQLTMITESAKLN